MASFNSLVDVKSSLLRKGLGAGLFVAPMSVAALTDICLPASAGPPIVNAGDLAPLTGYVPFGRLTTDGITVGSSYNTSEMRGLGDAYPARIDVTDGTNTMTVTPMETRQAVEDAFTGVDQTGVKKNAAGTLQWDKPKLPVIRDKRVLALIRDTNVDGSGDIYMGVFFPRSNITPGGDQTYNNSDAGINFPMTVNALNDDTLGTPCRLFFGGPGLASLITAMSYT